MRAFPAQIRPGLLVAVVGCFFMAVAAGLTGNATAEKGIPSNEGVAPTAPNTARPQNTAASGPQPFAVLELFTSEGCSSCPPADRLLGQIVESARAKGSRVYPLAFHVDYWDRLGWHDPFSNAAYSERQYAYAKVIPGHRVYTPQLIVNGRMAFVGSDRGKTQAAIDTSLMRPAPLGLELRLAPGQPIAKNDHPSTRGKTLAMSYRIEGRAKDLPPDAVLNVALVERGLSSNVLRGENAGRNLTHENVVRAFRTIRLTNSRSGVVHLTPPANFRPEHSSVIAYIQNPKTMAILAAAATDQWSVHPSTLDTVP